MLRYNTLMTTTNNKTTYRSYLERQYQARRGKNSAYSLRAFARNLGIAAPKLSQIFSGSCGLSGESAQRIAKKLDLSETETQYFVALVELEHSRSKIGKAQAQAWKKESFLLGHSTLPSGSNEKNY